MEKLVILDYSDTSVHIFEFNPEDEIDDSYIERLGFNCNNCYWMCSSYLEVVYHSTLSK